LAKTGFKRKLTAILSANAKRYSQLMYDHEKPIPHNLMHYRIYKNDLHSNTGSPSFNGQPDVMKGYI
jgi:hypothetical protein